MTVLVVARKDDVHADLVIRELYALHRNVFRYNTECADEFDVALSLSDSSSFLENKKTGLRISFKEISAVYLRRRSSPDTSVSEKYRNFVRSEWLALYGNMFGFLGGRKWINYPESLARAENKILQLMKAKEIGLRIPHTIMTNSCNEARVLCRNQENSVYKPFRSGELGRQSDCALYTSMLHDLENDSNADWQLSVCPGIFQEYIDKAFEVRVTVVGDHVFSARIDSQSSARTMIDWRRYENGNTPHSSFQIPDAVASKCVTLVRDLGLIFGALDLIVTPDGEYVFLEINPNGQWAWIEIATGHKIAKSIAEQLCM